MLNLIYHYHKAYLLKTENEESIKDTLYTISSDKRRLEQTYNKFDKISKKIFKVINLEYLYKEEFIQKIHAFRRGEHPFDADKAAIEAEGIQYKYFRYSNCSYISDSRMVRNFLRTELPRHFKNIVDLNAFKITITNKKTPSENEEIEPSPSCFSEPKETIEIDSAVSVFQKSAALPEQVKAFIENEQASIAKKNCNKSY